MIAEIKMIVDFCRPAALVIIMAAIGMGCSIIWGAVRRRRSRIQTRQPSAVEVEACIEQAWSPPHFRSPITSSRLSKGFHDLALPLGVTQQQASISLASSATTRTSRQSRSVSRDSRPSLS